MEARAGRPRRAQRFVGPAGRPSFPVVCREQRSNVDRQDQSPRKASLNLEDVEGEAGHCGSAGLTPGQEREAQPGAALPLVRVVSAGARRRRGTGMFSNTW